LKKAEPKPTGDADMVFKNPGAVTYADLKAYMEKRIKKDIKANYETTKNYKP
jgi:hypothetical protein